MIRLAVQVHLDESYDENEGYMEPFDAYEYCWASNVVEVVDKWRNKGWTIVRTFLADEYGRELTDNGNIVH